MRGPENGVLDRYSPGTRVDQLGDPTDRDLPGSIDRRRVRQADDSSKRRGSVIFSTRSGTLRVELHLELDV